jgi:hypothetical protein
MMKAITTSKRGRPKSIAPANDNRPDLGTQELQLKRATLAQGADPAASAHPLDLLLARGLILPQAHRAGWRYAGLYRRVIGRTDVSYGRLYAGLGGEHGGGEHGRGDTRRVATTEGDDNGLRLAQLNFRQAQAVLRAEGPVVAGITERLVVYGAWPDWLLAPLTRAHRELDLLRRGLGRLVSVAHANNKLANDNMPPRATS